MSVDLDSLVPFFMMWGIPAFMMVRAYVKMDEDDRQAAKNDFKTPHFIFTIGLLVIGYFFTSVGNLLSVSTIKLIGIILMIIAGIVITVDLVWKNEWKRMVIVLVLIGIAIFFSW